MSADGFVIGDSCTVLHDAPGFIVYTDAHGITRAVLSIDEDSNPLSGCDPNRHGYALVMVNYIDAAEGVAVCEVVSMAELGVSMAVVS